MLISNSPRAHREYQRIDLKFISVPYECTWHSLRKWCHDTVNHERFEWTVLFLILINLVVLGVDHTRTCTIDGVEQACLMEEGLANILELLNVVFLFVFSLEWVMKARHMTCDSGVYIH